jgi:hypothetical protein
MNGYPEGFAIKLKFGYKIKSWFRKNILRKQPDFSSKTGTVKIRYVALVSDWFDGIPLSVKNQIIIDYIWMVE